MRTKKNKRRICGGAAAEDRSLLVRILDGIRIPGIDPPEDSQSTTDHGRMIRDQRRIKGMIYAVTTDLQESVGLLNNYQVVEPTAGTGPMKDRILHFRMKVLPKMLILKGDLLEVLTDALAVSEGLTASLEKMPEKDDKYHRVCMQVIEN